MTDGTVTYRIEVSGDAYDHETFRELVADFDGASIKGESVDE